MGEGRDCRPGRGHDRVCPGGGGGHPDFLGQRPSLASGQCSQQAARRLNPAPWGH